MRNEQTVWITGAGGLIGNALLQSAPQHATGWRTVGIFHAPGVRPSSGAANVSSPKGFGKIKTPSLLDVAAGEDARTTGHGPKPHDRLELDLTDFGSVERAFHAAPPNLVIHCAAVSKSPACQADPAQARRLNVEATRHLAELSADIPFFFFSTDLVFDGRKGNYIESDTPNPLSVYAETKAAAEQIVLVNPRHTVLRTSLNGGQSPAGDRGFNEEMRRAWREGKTLTLFTDEFRCPIPASVTARAVWELAAQNQPGLYHLAGAERLSRWEIGRLLAARWPQLNPRLQPESLRSYQGPPRSPDTSLNCAKVQELLSFPLPGLSRWLEENPSEEF